MTTLDQETAGLFAGSYPLGRLLGRGGMADVYASVDARTGDPVAVKVFRDTDLGGADRRSAEVRTLTGLRHPNLVELIDAGTQDGCEFLVMALVEGPTLGQACRHRRLPLARSAQIAAAVGDALAYVHAGDVVHRDVKPDNVLLGPGPRVRLADFGIARTMSATRATQSGLVLGTAAYLAPEQVTGAEVGPPADVYALGLVLLECLTGHREYPGAALESAMARLHRSPQLPAELPAGWAALLAAMTATDPATRPSAGSAAGALHQLAAAPHTTVAALAQVMGAPLRVPIPAAPAAPAPPAAAVAPPGAAADADLGRPAAGDTSPRRRWRLLALAAATLLALTPVSVAGERALRFGSSPGQPTPGTQRAPVAGVVAQPVAPPARHQPADAARPEPPAAQAGQASAPQPSAPAAGGSGDTQAAPAGHVGASSPPTAISTPVAGPADSPGAASGASGGAGGASRDGPASSSTTTGAPGPAGAGSPAARAGSSSAASTGSAPGGTSPSPSGSSSAATPSSAPPSRSPDDTTSGPATSGTTSTAPSPSAPTSAATSSGPGITTTSGAGQGPGNSTSPSASHGPSGGQRDG